MATHVHGLAALILVTAVAGCASPTVQSTAQQSTPQQPAAAPQPVASAPGATPASPAAVPREPAQAPTQTPAPSWAQGRPGSLENSTLAPHPPGLIAKAATDIPVDRLKLPPGFQAQVWATGMANARSMTVGSKGTVFVGARLVGNVYAVVDRGDRREVKVIAKGLHRPNGVAFKDGALYVAELSRVVRYDNIEDRLDNPPAPVVVYSDLPKDEPHGWKFIAFGPDGKLYIPIGTPCNICEPPDTHAQIRRINPDGTGMEVVARGVRNTVGFDWDPQTKQMWFTDNGRDWMGDDMPADELNRLSQPGKQHFGFPFCHQGDTPDPEFAKGRSCAEAAKPELNIGAHVGALGMRFYTGGMFPPEYRDRILIARHGSWNRNQKVGFDVVQVVRGADGSTKLEPFLTGFRDGEKYWGRPADVQVLRDGSVLVSDDVSGALIRVTYGR
jgi:glucose/arabinose dehydrogenase